MSENKTTLEAEVRNGKLVVIREVYEGRKYVPGENREDDIRHKRNINFLQEFLERAKEVWLYYNS